MKDYSIAPTLAHAQRGLDAYLVLPLPPVCAVVRRLRVPRREVQRSADRSLYIRRLQLVVSCVELYVFYLFLSGIGFLLPAVYCLTRLDQWRARNHARGASVREYASRFKP